MRLGFYSDVARRNIVKARAFIASGLCGDGQTRFGAAAKDLMDLEKSARSRSTLKNKDFSASARAVIYFSRSGAAYDADRIDTFSGTMILRFLG